MTLGRLVDKVLARVGFELRRRTPAIPDRISHTEVLRNARRIGLAANTIIDVGAAFGDFTSAALEIFPGADVLLIEPLDEYAPSLASVSSASPSSRIEWIKAVAGVEAGTAVINVYRCGRILTA